jgi:VanZ family protein
MEIRRYRGRGVPSPRLAPTLLASLLVLAIMAAIFCFSAQSARESSHLSTSFARRLFLFFRPALAVYNDEQWQALLLATGLYIRKAAHFTEFFALGVSLRLWFAALGKPRRALLPAWLLATLYAATDELHQMFVDGRGPALLDVGIDSLGALCGAALVALCISRRKR